MTHFFRCLLGCAGLLVAGSVQAQGVGYGDWQLHLPSNRPQKLADAGDRLYVATEQKTFYLLDKKQNTTQLLSRRDGLNGTGVAAVAYDSVTRQTVLAYNNTNIDVLQPNGKVRNINDVFRKVSQGVVRAGDEPINRVSVGDGKAYISTNFGLVALDMTKLELSDTYTNIGPGGSVVAVYDAASANGYLYAATSVGILRGSLTRNLLDYNNWTLYQPVPPVVQRKVYHFLAVDGGQVYAGIEDGGNSVYKFVAGSSAPWQQVPGTYTIQFRSLRGGGAGLLLVDDDYGVRRLNRSTGVVTTEVAPTPGARAQDAVRSRDGYYYVANLDKGLQRIAPGVGKTPEYFEANGPQNVASFSILADARFNKIDVFSGGYEERYAPLLGLRGGFYEFANGQWSNFTAETRPSSVYPNPDRPVRGARTPNEILYMGHFGGGLLEWKGPSDFRIFNPNSPPGTPLLSTNGGGPDRVDVTDLAATPDGKVWVVNRHMQPSKSGLFLFDPAATTWQVIPFAAGLEALERITLDDNGIPWVSVSRKTDGTTGTPGIYAIDPTGANAPRFFTTSSGLPDNQIYELAKDRRGYIWAATIKGVAYFSEPGGPFGNNSVFQLPIVKRGEGVGYAALYSEAVRCMAVDGADRKWFGTDRGLWLFSRDADEALLHFTTANSPLPSDRIVDVKVNDKTGEVWVATDAGVVAYRGSATVTEGKPDCTAVFPNPVRPDFAGTLGISGLANNALVKITDVAGHLVYATTATGGTVTWNLTNPNGERVRSGVYLVLSSDADGKNGCVSKVAVLSK